MFEWIVEKFIGSDISYTVYGIIGVALIGLIKKKISNEKIASLGKWVGNIIFQVVEKVGIILENVFNFITGMGKAYWGNKIVDALIGFLFKDCAEPFYSAMMKEVRKVKTNWLEYWAVRISTGVNKVTKESVKKLIADRQAEKLLKEKEKGSKS